MYMIYDFQPETYYINLPRLIHTWYL